MDYAVLALLAFSGGIICSLVALANKHRKLAEQRLNQESAAGQLQEIERQLGAKQQSLQQDADNMAKFHAQWMHDAESSLSAQQHAFDERARQLEAAEAALNTRVVSYKELQDENALIKRDLRNAHLIANKQRFDVQLQREAQEALNAKVTELGGRYLKENVKWIGASLNPNNFVKCRQRLLAVIERCRAIGFNVSAEEESELIANLREEYENVVRAAFEREEQARIKAQIREEQAREKAIEREIKQLEREREAIKAALEKAIAEAKDQHNEEVERLKARLAEAEERSQRAISQAQLTKSGNVYVISNLGSFGENVFKIGMTRRLEPMDRVRELGDASVPFPFDVHMMIASDDAPSLENALHRALHKLRINKTNPRKEFFKVDIETVARIVEENLGEVRYVADAEALQYRQSLEMTDEDSEFIESVYDTIEDEDAAFADD